MTLLTNIRDVMVGVVFLFLTLGVGASSDYGIDPEAELRKLEKGDLRILSHIKVQAGGDVLTFFKMHKIFVAPALSDVACSEEQINYLKPGCTISVQVTNGRVKHINECATILSWRRADKNAPFLPANGWAEAIERNPNSLLAVLKDNELHCDKAMR